MDPLLHSLHALFVFLAGAGTRLLLVLLVMAALTFPVLLAVGAWHGIQHLRHHGPHWVPHRR